MIFRYEIGDDYSSEYFYYDPDYCDLLDELTNIIINDYFSDLKKSLNSEQRDKLRKGISSFLSDNEMHHNKDFLECYEDQLKEAFESRAYELYADSCYKEGDPYASQHI